MKGTLFDRRTSIDAEFEKNEDAMPPQFSIDMMEACVRLLSRQKGMHATAVVMQRIADDCAGIDLKPIDHWRSDPDKPCRAAKPSVGRRLWKWLIEDLSLPAFYLGLAIGIWMGGFRG